MLELEVTLPRENSKRTNQRLLSVMLELLVPYKTLLGVTQVTTRGEKSRQLCLLKVTLPRRRQIEGMGEGERKNQDKESYHSVIVCIVGTRRNPAEEHIKQRTSQ